MHCLVYYYVQCMTQAHACHGCVVFWNGNKWLKIGCNMISDYLFSFIGVEVQAIAHQLFNSEFTAKLENVQGASSLRVWLEEDDTEKPQKAISISKKGDGLSRLEDILRRE